ncbi:hypothetical protein [Algiphilus aromaticivorans]|uniref:hypothetical protein n=1 Tax=Algiphilus aromaticivorans TaxID=382454 RepID=UPI0012EC0CE1|nr:hypothetical protein [Algiphilus aromaticivorans]
MHTLRKALQRALLKPAPDTIPLSGNKAYENDCYTIYFNSKDGTQRIYVTGFTKDIVTGKLWDRKSGEAQDCKKPLQEINSEGWSMEAERFFRGRQFQYRKPTKLLFDDYLFVPSIKVKLDRLEQLAFNRRPLARLDRHELLSKLVEERMQNGRQVVSPMHVGLSWFSTRWIFHPERTVHQEHIKLLLDSFLDSGELKTKGTFSDYEITGKALATLDAFDREKSRHDDQIRASGTLTTLTFWLVVVGLLNFAVYLYATLNSPG